MKFSNKDILLLVGIIVAVIITLTTVVYKENAASPKTTENDAKPKIGIISPSALIKKVIAQIDLGDGSLKNF